MAKRGRPPLGRKAMSPAQRQARHRAVVRKREQEHLHQEGMRRLYQPPHGYGKAKEQLLAAGHEFERARREFGFEDGVFVDGAFLGSSEVIQLAELSQEERSQRLAARRIEQKDDACGAVEGYMARLHITLEELIAYAGGRRAWHRASR
jgi:hypothetical protein